ncbi:L-type lectin-domain containing receptor kinase I.9-like isoform X2 [Cryptomeria japonica]|uniref:L-type lectin-domain containing receptor kinase I.9-like isoform X2 n=1 Tax=Cryptomeria japonica TaxID=3369 RepID=UPI0027DA58D8|nr:L-type lectin-domain containing receptor kinase I.9-like isoform X2 [Cryptomeria japonica]
MSQQQPYRNVAGGLPSERSTTTEEIFQCDMENAAQTETFAADTNGVSGVNERKIDEASHWKDRPQKTKRLLPTFFRFPTCPTKLRECRSQYQRNQKTVAGAIFVWKRNKHGDFIEEWEKEFWPHRFNYKDLHIATKGFGEEQVLSYGGSSRV